jgi:3-deoxy-D-manno-octulosonic-acid transferase
MSAVESDVAVEAGEAEAISRLVERLVARFPQVPPLTVQRSVSSAHRAFDGARVRLFVPLLVEHDATAQLKALAQQASGPAPLRSVP